ncbi:MAG: hypothetical protein ACOYYS_19710 [Chloroflexota bacterium]
MSGDILVELTKRDLSTQLPFMPVKLTVRDYSWHVWGGPLTANIDVEAETPLLMWEIVEWLRYGVKLRSKATARACWWGFVDAIQLSDGVVNFGVELDSMNNRAMANYTYQGDGESQTSSMSTTWVQDDDSVGTYGAKELQVQSNNCSTALAESDRDKALNAFKYPQPTINTGGSGSGKLSGSLRLSGWWKTLDWMYYINASTAYQTVATQINSIYTQCGQFMTGIDMQATAGILSSEYRDGSRMGRSEMEDLLRAGASSAGWLMANVDENRMITVTDEPERDADYFFIANDGSLTNKFNAPILPEECPVGKWLYMRSGIPETADLSAVERPFPAFIVEAAYEAKTASYRPVTRGRPSPYELMGAITK